MAAKQTPILMGRLVANQQYFNPLPTEDAQWAIRNPKDAAALCVTAIQERKKVAPKANIYKVLRPAPLKSVEPRSFRAVETFFSKTSGVRMAAEHGLDFVDWFAGHVEEDVSVGDLVPFILTQSTYDDRILADLGGGKKAKTTLCEIWRLMQRQANGEDGVLLTNGYANIFYVQDVNGILRTVVVRWHSDGWFACSFELGDSMFYPPYQVFSRNF